MPARLRRAGRGALALGALLVAGLAGCGSSEDEGDGRQGRDSGPLRVATLGDSITAGNPGFDPDRRARKFLGFGDNPRSQYQYWAAREDPRLRFRNCGVNGQTTAEIGARLLQCARGADVLIVQGGINDIARSMPAPPELRRGAVNRAANNLAAITRQADQLGLRVAVTDVLPWNAGPDSAAPLIKRLNRLIGVNARLQGITLLRFNDALANPRAPERMPPRLTADELHPSVAGYRRLGERAFRLPR